MMENVVLSIMTVSLEGRGDSPLECISTIGFLADQAISSQMPAIDSRPGQEQLD
jgi:hypothetical protein